MKSIYFITQKTKKYYTSMCYFTTGSRVVIVMTHASEEACKCTAVKVALAKIAIKNAGHRAGPGCRGTLSIKVVGEAQHAQP